MQAHRHPRTPINSPATVAAEVTVYQDSDGQSEAPSANLPIPYEWIGVAFKLDKEVTLYHKWGPTLKTADDDLETLDTVVAPANTFFRRWSYRQPGRNKITIVATDAAAPTASKIAVELSDWAGQVYGGLSVPT